MDELNQDDWEVKRVTDKRLNDVTGGIEYLLEWKNWDGPPTWEPEENCDCKELIKRFEKERAKRDGQPPSRSQSRTPTVNRRHSGAASNRSQATSSATQDRRRSARVRESSQRRVLDEITIDSDQDDDVVDDEHDRDVDHREDNQHTGAAKNKDTSKTRSCLSDSDRTETPPPPASKPFPRAKTPEHSGDCCKSPCTELQPPLTSNEYEAEMRKRKLVLKDIIGAVNSKEILLIVKWHGIASLEKVPLQVLRRFHSQDILDFLLEKIKWK